MTILLKASILEFDVDINRQTASKHLEQLIERKLVALHKIGKKNYINTALYDFLHNVPQQFKFK